MMEDWKIVELYWARNEEAINQTKLKYGKYCRKIACSILYDSDDADECINDTYLSTWNSLPPNKPEMLSTYVGKICRNIAINLYQRLTAAKRGGSQTELCLDELLDIADDSAVEDQIELRELSNSINQFLDNLEKENRIIFVKRYWYMEAIKEIAKDLKISESKAKMSLLRTRNKLKEHLLKEGYSL